MMRAVWRTAAQIGTDRVVPRLVWRTNQNNDES